MKQARRNTLIALSFIICLLSFSTTLCSCSSDDETATDTQEDSNGRRMRQLTISNVSMATRATIDPLNYAAAWATNDKATYFNLSAYQQGRDTKYGALTASAAGTNTTLTGDVWCANGDNIAVIFPAMPDNFSKPSDGYFTINLNGQKGTLDDIGTNYHYVYGEARKLTVSGNSVTGTIHSMKSLLSLCKFTFTNNGNPVNVKSVQINYFSTITSIGYPTTGTVKIDPDFDVTKDPEYNQEDYYSNDEYAYRLDLKGIIAEASAYPYSGPLTISLANANADGVVYAALFPVGSPATEEYPTAVKQDFHFTVTDNDGKTYIGTKKAIMLEGKYYEVTINVTPQ